MIIVAWIGIKIAASEKGIGEVLTAPAATAAVWTAAFASSYIIITYLSLIIIRLHIDTYCRKKEKPLAFFTKGLLIIIYLIDHSTNTSFTIARQLCQLTYI